MQSKHHRRGRRSFDLPRGGPPPHDRKPWPLLGRKVERQSRTLPVGGGLDESACSVKLAATRGPTESFRRRDGSNRGLFGKQIRVRKAREQDDRIGVQDAHAPAGRGHRDGSITSSTCSLRATGSRWGKWRHRPSKVAGSGPLRGRGRSSATGRPDRVTVRRSPARTRSSTRHPLFRRSRVVTSAIPHSMTRETFLAIPLGFPLPRHGLLSLRKGLWPGSRTTRRKRRSNRKHRLPDHP